MQVTSSELIYESDKPLLSPVAARKPRGDFYFSSSAGVVYAHADGTTSVAHETGAGLQAAVPDGLGGFFIAATADRTLRHFELEGPPEGEVAARSFGGEPLIGVNTLLYDAPANRLFFTDAGPWAHSGLHRPVGSLFEFRLGENAPRALAHRCLAAPAGLALSPARDVLYLCETPRNAVLRVLLARAKPLLLLFRQFAGGVGPRALACTADGRVVAAHTEAAAVGSAGALSLLSAEGALLARVELPKMGRINGLLLLSEQSLVVTEDGGSCHRLGVSL